MDPDDVDLPEGAAYYLCGPLPFMTMRSWMSRSHGEQASTTFLTRTRR
jgi:hypothetical protein